VRAVLRRPRLLVPSVLSFGNVELRVGTNEAIVADNKVLLRRRESLDPRRAADAKGPRCHTRRPDRGDLWFDDEIESNTLEAQVSRPPQKAGRAWW